MSLIVGTGIDDRDLALAHDVTNGAGKGERTWIIAENPPHFGADLVDHAGFQRKIAVERDVVVFGHGASVICGFPFELGFVTSGLVQRIRDFLVRPRRGGPGQARPKTVVPSRNAL